MQKLLEVKNLKTYFQIEGRTAKAVDGLDFHINEGEVLGIVGESGSGKSVTSLSLIQLIPNPPGEVTHGEIYFRGEKIFDGKELEQIKAQPHYAVADSLPEAVRHTIFVVFSLLLIIGLGVAPWSGIVSLVVFFIILPIAFKVWYHSPRTKAYHAFREKMFKRVRQMRGREIAMIFQEPMTSLNPVFSIGIQITEAIRPRKLSEYFKDWLIRTKKTIRSSPFLTKIKILLTSAILVSFFSQLASGWTFQWESLLASFTIGFHIPIAFSVCVLLANLFISKKFRQESEELFQQGVSLLEAVGIPDAEKRMFDYPHQFSGGMRQRVMIAMALAKNPSLLIADEPTTALDVTIQAQILDLMKEVKNRRQEAAIVLITHDLAVVAETCQRVIVMYGGKIQEVAEIQELFNNPLHPYTHGLLQSIPKPDPNKPPRERLAAIKGMVPNIFDFPKGCKFSTRCDRVMPHCHDNEPRLMEIGNNHQVRCHLYSDDANQSLNSAQEVAE